jgi:hypothetical protein
MNRRKRLPLQLTINPQAKKGVRTLSFLDDWLLISEPGFKLESYTYTFRKNTRREMRAT